MTIAVPYKGSALTAFEPGSLAELIQLSEVMARSEMVPKDYIGKPGNIVTAIMAGREIGLSAYQSLQSHAVIKGRAMLWGDAPLGIVRASGKLKSIREWMEGEGDGRMAVCSVWRVGDEEAVQQTFSVLDAKTAGLWKKEGPWTNYPDRMMKMRARSFVLRDTFGDVLKGVAIAEEYEGHEERNITPGSPVSGNDVLRTKLAETLGAGALAKAPQEVAPVPVEGVVEDPLPDFTKMLKEQIADVLEQEAQARGMDGGTYRDVVTATLQGEREKRRPLTRETAVEVCRAIRAWVAPRPVDEPEATPTTEEPALF